VISKVESKLWISDPNPPDRCHTHFLSTSSHSTVKSATRQQKSEHEKLCACSVVGVHALSIHPLKHFDA
jgi:hypothetical protein